MLYALALLWACTVDPDVDCDATCPEGTNQVAMDFESTVMQGTLAVEGDRCLSFCEPIAPCQFPNIPIVDEDRFRCEPLEGYTTLGQTVEVDTSFGAAWGPLTESVATPANLFPEDATSGDFDGDGFGDLVVVTSREVSVWFGDGAGGFSAAGAPLVDVVGATTAAVAEVTGDGRDDLILGVPGLSDTDLWLYPGNGDGTVGAPTLLVADTGDKILAYDMDGDGTTDLVSQRPPTEVHFLDGQSATTVGLPAASWGDTWVTHRVGDLNGDGALDLFASAGGGSVFVNRGDRSFDAPITGLDGDALVHTLPLDIDRDGADEVLVYNSDNRWFNLYGGPELSLLGTLADTPYNFDDQTADLTGDGAPDLLAVEGGFIASSDSLGAYFAGRPGPTTGFYATPVDFDGDGVSEMVVFEGQTLWGVWP